MCVCVCVCKCVSGCVWYFWYFCYDNNDINNNLFITLMKNCNIERTDNPSDLSILQASASAGLAGPGQVTRIQLAPSACYLYTVFPWRAFIFFSSYWASNALKEAGCPVLLKTMTKVSGDKWPQPTTQDVVPKHLVCLLRTQGESRSSNSSSPPTVILIITDTNKEG